jgi:LPXTG-motif cell wall-anchored protein
MKKRILLIGLVASIWAAGFAPGLVLAGGLRSAPAGGGAPASGGGAPAPEIGASALGLLLASGTALYILRRRKM